MALFELKQDTGSGAAAPWAPPTFKDCVAADIDAAFFEENEHADRHTVDGKDVLIVLEDDDLREHSAHWEAGAKQNFDTGLYTAHTILYIRVEDYGPKPKIGKQLVLDKVGEVVYSGSALAAALTAYTDAVNADTPNVSPSNKTLAISAACLADGTEVVLDQEQANTVNGFGVATFLNMSGFRLWGNNTAAYPSTTDPKDRSRNGCPYLAARAFPSIYPPCPCWQGAALRTAFLSPVKPEPRR